MINQVNHRLKMFSEVNFRKDLIWEGAACSPFSGIYFRMNSVIMFYFQLICLFIFSKLHNLLSAIYHGKILKSQISLWNTSNSFWVSFFGDKYKDYWLIKVIYAKSLEKGEATLCVWLNVSTIMTTFTSLTYILNRTHSTL